ncbi:MAG: DUF1810 domain-containing protein [Muribaculum sp.]|nr:DUF1810 domain-containing protein [Muribaculum sp.]
MDSKKSDITRFVEAQGENYERALHEIKSGRKRSHWMWYIFPQLKGLGRSVTSSYYGIHGLAEAEKYLSHPLLGNRLREISQALLELDNNDAHSIFGSPDDWKLRSCMTLFDKISPNDIFNDVLNKYFGGDTDSKTLRLLKL